jgi:3-methylfumaryl-CoA hydratase
MSAGAAPDLAALRAWVGREETAHDTLTESLVARFHAALDLPGDPARGGEAAPGLIHFCLCLPAVATSGLGADGHPRTGGFLPPVPLPRRMWAGSEMTFTGDLRVGEPVARLSRVADVAWKEGRTGALCFVTVDHRFSSAGHDVIAERQTIVYRGLAAGGAAEAAPQAETSEPAAATIAVSPPLLMRYSALTFNAHRIHYDLPYATGEEGYAGLVVHGPLQATLLLHHAALQRGGQTPDRFSFRSASPLFAHDPLELHHRATDPARMDLWTSRPGGPAAMRAEAAWLS